jgi:parallel beta-helix repeat protein
MRGSQKALALAIFIVLVSPVIYLRPATALEVRVVPDDYASIQQAIDHTNSGGTVFVRNGIYSEDIIVTKPINLVGESVSQTILNGTGSVVTVTDTSNVNVNNFTIVTPKILYDDRKHGYPHMGEYGIYLGDNSTQSRITDNRIINTKYGVYISSTSGNSVTNNLFIDHGTAINLYESASNVISGNTIANSTRGIFLQRSSNNQILANTIINQTADGIVALGTQGESKGQSTYNSIEANQIAFCGDHSIRLYDSAFNNVTENNIWNCSRMALASASFNFVISNLIVNSYDGLEVNIADSNIISANRILNSRYGGIVTMNTSNNEIRGNKITGCETGINLDYSTNNLVYANDISNAQSAYSFFGTNGSYPFNTPLSEFHPITDPVPPIRPIPEVNITGYAFPNSNPPKSTTPSMTPIILVVLITILLVASAIAFRQHNRNNKFTSARAKE